MSSLLKCALCDTAAVCAPDLHPNLGCNLSPAFTVFEEDLAYRDALASRDM